MTRAGLAVCAVAIAVFGSTHARAVPAAPAFLVLDLDGCREPSADIRKIVEVELRRSVALLDAAGSDAPDAAAPGVTTVRLTCDERAANIDIVDPVTVKTLKRTVALQPVAPVARAHLIALAIVELLLASWSELLTDADPGAGSVGAAAAPEARVAALELVRDRALNDTPPWMSLRVLAVGVASSFAANKSLAAQPWLFGGALVVAGDGPRHLGWLADLTFQHGGRSLSQGQVSADSLTALAAAVGHWSRGRFVFRGGLGMRGGVVWLGGTPRDSEITVGGAVRGFSWGPAALLDGGVRVGRRGVVTIAFELGRAALPVTAFVQGDDPVVIGGTWIRAGVGVGLAQ
jgi:hypothetical protein